MVEVRHHNDVPWSLAPIPWPWHRCQPWSIGIGDPEWQRCACGAVRMDEDGEWLYRNGRRKGLM